MIRHKLYKDMLCVLPLPVVPPLVTVSHPMCSTAGVPRLPSPGARPHQAMCLLPTIATVALPADNQLTISPHSALLISAVVVAKSYGEPPPDHLTSYLYPALDISKV